MARAAGGTVTLLFTDLVRSTELLERLGDDEYEVVRRMHFRLLRREVAAQGGQEVKTVGDSLMVVFASVLDALACAVAMQQAVHRRNQQQEIEHRLHVRVGLHVGEPNRDAEDYFGTPVVVARRLCDHAQGGQVLASELVRGLAGSRGGYNFRDLDPISLKGFAEPVAACEVVWEPAVEEPATDQPTADEPTACLPLPPLLAVDERTAFVGRQRELEDLWHPWERAKAGQRRLVLIAGEPGIGKTRLAAEFALTAHAKGATVLFGRSYEEALIPYQPFVEALHHYVVACPLVVLRQQVAASGEELARLLPELAQRLPDLSGVSSSRRSLAEPLGSDPDSERYRLFEAVASFLVEASRACPIVLVLDDLHWSDKPTLLLLRHIVRSLEQSPLLIVGTYREMELDRTHPLSDTLADLRRDRAFERVSLKGLDENDVAAMIGARGGQEAPPELIQAVHERTEGNPFFTEEVLTHLVETGAISRREGRWAYNAASIEELGIPEGIKEVIGRRLSRLSEECDSVLTVAAVIGRRFDLDILEQVSDLSDERLVDVLEEAIAAGIVLETEEPHAVGRYTFSHPLTRETLYEEPSTTRRVRLHRRIGEVLEQLSEANPEPRLAALAYHFCEAASGGLDANKAIDYAARAGEQATALLAYEEAVGHYERALQALELKEPADEAQRCELLLALGDALWRAGENPRARQTFEWAADIATKLKAPEELSRAALGYGAGGAVVGTVDKSLVGLLEEALGALGERDSTLRARLLARLAEELYFSDSQRRRAELSREAVEMARRVADPATLAAALRSRHLALRGPEQVESRIVVATEILGLAEDADDRALAWQGHYYRLIGLLGLGDIAAADAEIEVLQRLAEELRQPRYLWFSTLARVMRAAIDGRFEESERLAQQGLVVGQRAHEPDALLTFGVQMFAVRQVQGRLEETEAAFKRFVERYPAVPALRCALAYLYSEADRAEEARTEFECLAGDGFAELPQDAYWLVGVSLLSDVCVSLGDAHRAATLYQLLLPYAQRTSLINQYVCMGSASRSLGLLAATMRRWEEAAKHFEDALEMNARMGARAWLAVAQHDYAQMLLARGRAGDRAKAQQLLDQALSTALELGMKTLVERARALKPELQGRR